MRGVYHFLKKYNLDKYFQKENLIVLVLGGILLAVIAVPVKKDEDVQVQETLSSVVEKTMENEVTEERGNQDYITMMEEKLENILSGIEGAGKVNVMITLQESEVLVVENDMVVKTIYPKVEGVVVIAQGAGTGKVKQHITEVIQALFDITIHKIKVVGSS